MMERESSREIQIEATLEELKKAGVELDPDQATHLKEKLAAAQPGDILNNEQFRISVDASGFTTEIGNFLEKKDK